jgi:ferredoxin
VADPRDQWPDNVGGSSAIDGRRWTFYTDRQCILCSVCTDVAPRNFRRSLQEDHDVVHAQPADPAELAACLQAEAWCPVEAIGHETG